MMCALVIWIFSCILIYNLFESNIQNFSYTECCMGVEHSIVGCMYICIYSQSIWDVELLVARGFFTIASFTKNHCLIAIFFCYANVVVLFLTTPFSSLCFHFISVFSFWLMKYFATKAKLIYTSSVV